MLKVRQPIAAGLFYPSDPVALERQLSDLFRQAKTSFAIPDLIIAPHAGYDYSGRVAASAYASLASCETTNQIKTVYLIGPSHKVALKKSALSSMQAFSTPLGRVKVDHRAIQALLTETSFNLEINDHAQAVEYSLEVQLPFLQKVLSDFSIVPIITAYQEEQSLCELIEWVKCQSHSLIIISTDLSHHLNFDETLIKRQKTVQKIEALEYENIANDEACGKVGLSAALKVLRARLGQVVTIDLDHSNRHNQCQDNVVAYGAFHAYFDRTMGLREQKKRYLRYQTDFDISQEKTTDQLFSVLKSEGYALIKTNDVSCDQIQAFLHRIAKPWMPELPKMVIEPIDMPRFIAHTDLEIEPHNECAYDKAPPHLLALFCEKNEVKGGQFSLVSGAEILANISPEFLPSLEKAIFRCSPAGEGSGFETTLLRSFQSSKEVLIYTAMGCLKGPFSYYELVNPVDEYSSKLIDHLNQKVCDSAFHHYHHWSKGDLLIIDNLAMLHARQSFSGDGRVLSHFRLTLDAF